MDMKKVEQTLENYFANLTKGQFKKDLIEAGFEIVEGIPGQIIYEDNIKIIDINNANAISRRKQWKN